MVFISIAYFYLFCIVTSIANAVTKLPTFFDEDEMDLLHSLHSARKLSMHGQPHVVLNVSSAFSTTPALSYFAQSPMLSFAKAALESFVAGLSAVDVLEAVDISPQAPFMFFQQKKAGGAHLRSQLHQAAVRMDIPVRDSCKAIANTAACDSTPLSISERAAVYTMHNRWADQDLLRMKYKSAQQSTDVSFSCVTNFQEPVSRVLGCIIGRYFVGHNHDSHHSQFTKANCVNELTAQELLELTIQADEAGASCLNEPYRIFSRIEDESVINQLGWVINESDRGAVEVVPSMTEMEVGTLEQVLSRVGQCAPFIIDHYTNSHRLLQKRFSRLEANGAFDIHHHDTIFSQGDAEPGSNASSLCAAVLPLQHAHLDVLERLTAYERLLYDAVVKRVDEAVAQLAALGQLPPERSDMDEHGFTHQPQVLNTLDGTPAPHHAVFSAAPKNATKQPRNEFKYVAGIAARRNYHAFAELISPLQMFPVEQQHKLQDLITAEYDSVRVDSMWKREVDVSVDNPLFFMHQRGSAGLTMRQSLNVAAKKLSLPMHIGCYGMACNTFTFPKEARAVYGMNMKWDEVTNFINRVHGSPAAPNKTAFSCITSMREPVSRLVSCAHRLLLSKRIHYGLPERACLRSIRPSLLFRMLVRETDEFGRSCLNEPFRYFSGLHDEVIIKTLGMEIDLKKHTVHASVDDYAIDSFRNTLQAISQCTPFVLEYGPSLLLLAYKYPTLYENEAFRMGRVVNQSNFTCGSNPQITHDQRQLFERFTALERVLYDAVLGKTNEAYEALLGGSNSVSE